MGAVKIFVLCAEIVIAVRNWKQGELLFFIGSSSFCFVDSDSEIPYRVYSIILGTSMLVFSLFVYTTLYYLKQTLLDVHTSIIIQINMNF